MTLFAVGDVQGCAQTFDALLSKIEFKPERDHLWLAGDLVNRGPDSLSVLRAVMALGDSASCVLGNHDLHLLAAAAGIRPTSSADTFGDVLAAPDADDLLDWLRHRPLLLRDKRSRRALVHAGIPPVWRMRQAMAHAAEIEDILRGASWHKVLRGMYGDVPVQWATDLSPADRRRFSINALTRIRFCDKSGGLDFSCSGPPGSQPGHLKPWFDFPKRRAKKWHIVFGHWSALGLMQRDDVTALDSGCVWGRELTAVPLDPPGAPIAIECRD